MLAVVGESDREHFASGAFTFQHDARIFHGQAGADVTVDPLYLSAFVGHAALSHEVKDIGRPILHGDVLDLGVLQCDQLDHCAVERSGFELRRSAAFHVGDLGVFVGDNERALELSEVFCVDPEVSLQGLLELHALGHVDEAAARESGAIQRREFVVGGRDHFAEVGAEDLRVFGEALGRTDEDDALLFEVFLHAGVGGFGVELRFHAGEELTLLLGDAETLEGFLHIVGHIVPGAGGHLPFGEVIADLVEIDILQVRVRPVGRHRLFLENLERLESEFAHPVVVVLNIRNVFDRVLGQTDAGIEFVVFGILEVPLLGVDAYGFVL